MAQKLVSSILAIKDGPTLTEKLAACPSVVDDLKALYSNKFLTDVTLKTKTNSFPAHKIVLCARSPVFTVMFSNDMKEKNTDSIQLDDLDDDTVQQLLLFLYSDNLCDLQWKTALKLYYAADKYQMEKLKLTCATFLINHLTTITAPELLLLADTHSDSDLREVVDDFIFEHDQQIFCSNEWEKLMEANPQLALQEMHLRNKYKTKKEMEELQRNVQGVLNELTPQKFECLLSRIKGLAIDTEQKLALVADLIYEKAIDEQNSVALYANLSKHLALITVPVFGSSGTQVNFRKLILLKCQKDFEQYSNLKNEEKIKALEAADPDKRKELQLVYEEEEKALKKRRLGNISFSGEIFKLGMLIEPIMHECIEKLLSLGDEVSLECVCKLLKTIGEKLDNPWGVIDSKMDKYIAKMKLVVDNPLTSSSLRTMLQDVIDMKNQNVQPILYLDTDWLMSRNM